MKSNARWAIVNALLQDDPERQALYRNSATFKAGLDQLVAFLPLFVHGLAAEAERTDERLASLQASLRR